MKVTLKWLQEYVDITLPPSELAEKLTMAGMEVNDLHVIGDEWGNVVIGQLVGIDSHPDADRLRLSTVDLGTDRVTVVNGAPNLRLGDKVAFAHVGASIINPYTGETIRLQSAKIRGGVMRDIYIHDIEMEGVDSPFKFELNWYPSYSYPTIPESIPKSEYKDHWRTMTIPVEPPERGIPEFHSMTFANISVKNAGTGFYVNAYPEKPMRNMLWKNIIIEAQKPGEITCAKDWVMENVTLLTPFNGSVKLDQVENVQLPRMFRVAAPSESPANPAESGHVLGH